MNADIINRFENNATRLLLDVARENSLENMIQKITHFVSELPYVVCYQIWLLENGDLCSSCPHRSACLDQTQCLHLFADGNDRLANAVTGKPLVDDPIASRLPLGMGLVGTVMDTGKGCRILDLDQHPNKLKGFDWCLKQEPIRLCSVMPIMHGDEILGVTISLAREVPPAETSPWAQILADCVGVAIANSRMFIKIRSLKEQLELQNTYLHEEVVEAKAFGDLIGQSAPLLQTISQIDLVAPTEASVLILGETGTGKERVAHEIHRRSPRKDGPLVRVNCASIPRELFESEFFGHVRGSFTGAIKDRAGRFEVADGGTLFLDEIGDVPLEMQGKLLRVLQEKCYERVGDDHSRRTNVRIIAATNHDLQKAIDAGRFREDLYYRLNVFPIQVVPLRKRRDDILPLAKHFLELSVRELRCAKPRLTQAAIAKLQEYDWPGNVRELRNVIERAVILARGGSLHFDLPVTKLSSPVPPSVGRRNEVKSEGRFLSEDEMRSYECNNLLSVLESTQWKIKGKNGAAELMGLNPTTLLSRIKKTGLKRPGH